MKKTKLRKWVKVGLSMMLVLFSILVYGLMANVGSFNLTDNGLQVAGILGWGWLFIGQFAMWTLIWE